VVQQEVLVWVPPLFRSGGGSETSGGARIWLGVGGGRIFWIITTLMSEKIFIRQSEIWQRSL
jgi:hypothetical protein